MVMYIHDEICGVIITIGNLHGVIYEVIVMRKSRDSEFSEA